MSRSDHFLLTRHARAPGVGDTSNFRVIVEIVTTSMQLVQRKRQMVARTRYYISKRFFSPWCRYIDIRSELLVL
jgi:hypothetical protein